MVFTVSNKEMAKIGSLKFETNIDIYLCLENLAAIEKIGKIGDLLSLLLSNSMKLLL